MIITAFGDTLLLSHIHGGQNRENPNPNGFCVVSFWNPPTIPRFLQRAEPAFGVVFYFENTYQVASHRPCTPIMS